MAGDKLVFEVVAEGKNLKVVQRDADALADSVERTDRARKKAGKGQDNYNKREKAIFQSNLSSAKGFSKMNQTIGSGSSGLVGAYATLAANVFAATAAFNALAGAARFEQLAAGLNAVGAAAGRNLDFASKKLVEVSGNAISTEQAMRSMALGISSGFSTEQMEGLTKVAKGASLALGRDMADAMDRLTRGAAKLEPEILDELGIMVRLDDATESYAAKLDKNVESLSQFERRQAFLNAILEQGDKKFGALAETIEVNQYDKLAATLNNLSKSFLTLVNAGLKPIVEVLAASQGMLLGVMILFASTIAKQVVPSIANLGKKTLEASQAETKAAGERLKNLKITKKMPNDYVQAAKAMAKGTINQQQFDKALRSTSASLVRHNANLKNLSVNNLESAGTYVKTRITMMQVNQARQQLIRNMQVYLTQQARENAANAIQLIGQGNLIKGFKLLSASISEYTMKTRLATASGSMLTKGLGLLRIGAFAAAGAARALGSAFMAMLGPIGLVVSVGMMLFDAFKDKLLPTAKVKEDTDEIIESLSSINETAQSFNETLRREGGLTASAMLAGFKAVSGILKDLSSNIAAVDQSAKDATGLVKLQSDLAVTADRLSRFKPVRTEVRKTGVGPGMRRKTVEIDAFGMTREEYESQIKSLGDSRDAAQAKFYESRAENATRLLNSYADRINNHPALKEIGAEQFNIITELRDRINDSTGETGLFEADIEAWKAEVGGAADQLDGIIGVFEGAADAAMNLRKSMNEAGQKRTTPFDKIIEDAKVVEERFLKFETDMAALGISTESNTDLYNQFLEALNTQMGTPAFAVEDAGKFVDHLETARETYLTTASDVKKLTKQHKLLNKVASSSETLEAFKAQLKAADAVIQRQIEGKDAEIKAMILSNATADERTAFIAAEKKGRKGITEFLKQDTELNDKVAKQIGERLELIAQEKTEAQKVFETEVARIEEQKNHLDIQKQLASAQKAQLNNVMKLHEAELQLQKAQNTGRALREGIDATPGDQLRTFLKFANARTQQALTEFNLAKQRIKLERELLNAKVVLDKANLQKALAEAADKDRQGIEDAIASLETVPGMMSTVFDAQLDAAESTYKLALKTLSVEEKKLELANLRTLIGEGALDSGVFGKGGKGLANFSQNMTKAMDAANAKAQANYVKRVTKAYMAGEGGMQDFSGMQFSAERAGKMAREDLQFALESEQFSFGAELSNLDKAMTSLQPMAEMFKAMSEMGGENSNMLAAMGSQMNMLPGVFSSEGMAESLGHLADAFDAEDGFGAKMEKLFGTGAGSIMEGIGGVAAALAVVSTVLQTIFAIQSAGTADKIVQIDKEIAATKKLGKARDTNEKKIAELEKKKEALKKKQFEQNKKMMIAQAIMATALGVVGALSLVGKYEIFAFVMAGLIAAMGAAQVAIISRMSYQGGGAGGGGTPSTPKIGVGSSSNKVDVAGSRQGGELGYMRGERGRGSSASDFTRTAFVGARYRATGGAAYVVGEQGPELFVPEVPGQIVANEDMAAAGTPINATFNIQTIDATNMEETLISQRGNIIGMIREAANNQGQDFLEGLDTMALGDSY